MQAGFDFADAAMLLAVVLGAGMVVAVLLRVLGRHEVRAQPRRR